ncbi:MAG: malto-oligosyltrehalose trehalohydrolase [Thermodesulfobacteriota bacterium]|nr:malto-oligosyltrehalose trehalohydrolase [Thermodesulfobacteriota bacterium]
MRHLKVWAPFAKTAQAQISGRTISLEKFRDNWWHTPDPVPAGTDYAFIVNAGRAIPDPRSPRQPRGIHGPSQTLDHSAFPWHDNAWQPPPLSSAVIYELHVGTFSDSGTFDGVINHLDHLTDLGITHVELMPVNGFSGTRGWGYDGVNLFAPHEFYGGPSGLKRLVDACHAKGLAVIIDVVYNHLGPAGNYLEEFGPYFTDQYHTPWGKAVNLDGPESHEVRRFFTDNAAMWLSDYHADGLRIDAIHTLIDLSAKHFLEELSETAAAVQDRTGRRKIVIAESDLNDPRVVTPVAANGLGMDAQWSDDFHHAAHAVLTGEKTGYYSDFGRLADLARALTRVFVYDGRFSAYRRKNHGKPVCNLRAHKFLAYLQTHDQAGNRALGERINHLISPERFKAGAAIMLLSPFIPMLFQAEEWAASSPFLYFTDHEDPELGEAVKKGRCDEFAAFGWDPEKIPDPQAGETFEQSVINWDEKDKEPHAGVLKWYKDLIALRKKIPEASDSRLERIHVDVNQSGQWLVMTRGKLIVACSLAAKKQLLPLPGADSMDLLLSSAKNPEINAKGITLSPDSVAVLYGLRQTEKNS